MGAARSAVAGLCIVAAVFGAACSVGTISAEDQAAGGPSAVAQDVEVLATYEPLGETREIAADEGSNRLVGTDQVSDGSLVVIDLVSLGESPGYVAVYADANGAPAQLLSNSELLQPGTYSAVTVAFDPPLEMSTDQPVFAMLHAEESGDRTMTFPGPDKPIEEDGRIVTLQIRLAADD